MGETRETREMGKILIPTPDSRLPTPYYLLPTNNHNKGLRIIREILDG
ncbi:MAG: hypothetical protein ACRDEA_19510 [Microcystaceae cyanobacterium]